MSKIEVNTVAPQCGTTLTLGESGDTVVLGTGASQTGFGRTGTVDWQTTPKTSTFTAADGEGYFINSSSPITMNLPAGSAGAIVSISDYARNFETHNFTISPNGSEKIGGVAEDAVLSVNGQAATFVYVDGTKGWVNVQNAEDTETGVVNAYITATGGTITTVCTNFKVHTFTGPGTFCISAGDGSLSKVDYLVIAGGGGGGGEEGGGGGAGGYRESKTSSVSGCWSASPLVAACGSLGPFSPGPITVTVGGGGTGIVCDSTPSTSGSNSVFSTIISTGGGRGGDQVGPTPKIGGPGGSGGGGSGQPSAPGGTGNTPPVSPAQGFSGGNGVARTGTTNEAGGGGGGATAAGVPGCNSPNPGGTGGNGGAGATTSINGSPTTRGGGGGGGAANNAGVVGSGGSGGGGAGTKNNTTAAAGTANTGGGGGGGGGNAGASGGARGGNGGSGLVIIRYRFQA